MDWTPTSRNASAVYRALQVGPMTRVEIERETGLNTGAVSVVLHRGTNKYYSQPKWIRIKEWVHDDPASNFSYPRPVYELGDKPDAKKPRRLTKAEIARRHRERSKIKVPSVWMWAASTKRQSAMRSSCPTTH